jgi:hypothetical protein
MGKNRGKTEEKACISSRNGAIPIVAAIVIPVNGHTY